MLHPGKGSHSAVSSFCQVTTSYFLHILYLPIIFLPSSLTLDCGLLGFCCCFVLRHCHTLSLWLAWNLQTPRPECCDSCLWAWLVCNGKKTSYQVGHPHTKPARLFLTLPISFLLHYIQNKPQKPVTSWQSSVHQQGSGSHLGSLCPQRAHILFSGHTVHFPCPTDLAS